MCFTLRCLVNGLLDNLILRRLDSMKAVLLKECIYLFATMQEAISFLDYWKNECGIEGKVVQIIDRR